LYSESTGENGICKEKDDEFLRCSDAKRSNQCPLSNINNLKESKCVWVVNTCYDVKSDCESITANEDACETEGAAIETNGDMLKCLWLKQNTTKNIVAKCINKVYSNPFFYYIIFFFYYFVGKCGM
jgi:hypothetical protein